MMRKLWMVAALLAVSLMVLPAQAAGPDDIVGI